MRFWPFGRKMGSEQAQPDCGETAIPTHLRPYFVPKELRDKTQIIGSLRCTCGCTAFSANVSKNDDCVFCAVCADCGQDILLFDARVHGWDALVCHMPGIYLAEGDVPAQCDKCGGGKFRVELLIEPTDKAEFVSCVEGELPDDVWVNAFTFFAVNLTYVSCGKRLSGWAEVETA